MKPTRQVGDFATEELVAKRVKDAGRTAGGDQAAKTMRLGPPPALRRAYSSWPG
jgi:hypothetical protein